MRLKLFYRSIIAWMERIPANITRRKVFIAEWYEILRKRNLYRDIHWTKEQKMEFDLFWIKNYGKKISPRWHKLYESMNGIHNIQYVPEILYTTKLEPKGNPYLYAKVFSDKGLVELLIHKTFVRVPRTILVCSDRVFRDDEYHNISEKDAQEIISNESQFVIKPTIGGSSGHSVEIINTEIEKDISVAQLQKKFGDNFIIQDVIKPHDSFKRLHPESINTIRIISYIADNDIKIAPISMRIGTGKTNVDNIHSGGVGVSVSNDGVLNQYAYQLGYCDSKIRYEKHPDTQIVFKGYQLPCIPEIIESAKKMHMKFPRITYISWDFTVDEDENIVLIEVNLFGQGVWLPQIVSGQGLFGEDIREIFKVIK
ncbi:MAG: hypothetical protein HFJ05_07195 [Eubacterium sp.]|nr:hypothetical protein [Eubacterium sp.]